MQIFHIVQEALANISRHSQARRARLTLQRGEQQLEILVEDDGRGLGESLNQQQVHGASGRSHFGLDIMQERAQRLGARVEIGSRSGGGTQVRLSIPQQGLHSPWRAS